MKQNAVLTAILNAHYIFPMISITSYYTIEVLRSWFALYGLPEELVSDNGNNWFPESLLTF